MPDWVLSGACVAPAKSSKIIHDSSADKSPLTPRGSISRTLRTQQCAKVAELRKTLLESGYHSLDRQAAALGLSRSTTWAILNREHKTSGLTGSVIGRMLRSPELPAAIRCVIEQYVEQKMAGAY